MSRGVFIALILCASTTVSAQSSGEESIEYTYQLPFLEHQRTISLSIPFETYTSVRLRGVSEGFRGLIGDTCTDFMENPAAGTATRTQLLADVTRSDQGESVYLGTFRKFGRHGIALLIQVANLSLMSDGFSTSSNAPSASGSDIFSSGGKKSLLGADFRYNFNLPGGAAIGCGYQFQYGGNGATLSQQRSILTMPDSAFQTNVSENNSSSWGPVNRLIAGSKFNTGGGSVQIYLYGTAASLHPDDDKLNAYMRNTPSTQSTIERIDYRTELKQRSIFLGSIYEIGGETDAITRYLFEGGYTSYDGKGSYRLTESYIGSPGGLFESTRNSGGSVFEGRIAAGLSRRAGKETNFFAGINLLYARNSFHIDEAPDSRSTIPAVYPIGKTSGDMYTVSFSIPLGFEYRVTDAFVLRGGAEEGYYYSDYSSGNNVYLQFGSSSNRLLSGTLWSIVSAGTTIRLMQRIELNTLVRYDFMDVAGVSLSAVYLLN